MKNNNGNHNSTSVPYGNDDESSLSLRDLFDIFLRRRELFLVIAIPVFLGILIFRLVRPYTPQYLATFDVGVSNERPVEGFFSQNLETPTVQIGSVTQRVISNLLSVKIAQKVADSLALHVNIKGANSDLAVEARYRADFDNPIGPYRIRFTNGSYTVYNKNGEKVAEALTGEFINLAFLDLKITPLKPIPQGKIYVVTFYPRENTALALRNSLSIKVLEADKIEKGVGATGIPYSGEGSSKSLVSAKSIFPGMNLLGILRINVYWGNPDGAIKIARVLSDLIIKEDIGEKSLQFIQSRNFIETQLTLYQERLNELEDRIKVFKESKKIANLNASTQALITQISTIETRKSQIQIEETILKNLNVFLTENHEGIDTTLNFAAALLSDQVMQNLYSQLLQTEADLKGKLKEYSQGHPKVLEIKAKLDGLKEQMKDEVGKRLSTIKTELSSVNDQIGILQAKLENVPADEVQLARLERDRETAEKLYTFFAEKLEETRVQEAGVTSDLKIINPPLVSSRPVNSRGRLTSLVLALILGLLTGGAATFVVEYFDNTVKDPDLIKTKTGLPIFASIPDFDDEDSPGIIKGIYDVLNRQPKPDQRLRTITDDISSAEFEAFRKLSINLEFAHPDKKYRVLYVTSPGPEEGKTFVTLNLGLVLAFTGKRAVVIDTDFRKKTGHLTDVAQAKKEIGIFDVLEGRSKLGDTVISLNIKEIKNGAEEKKSKEAEEKRGKGAEEQRTQLIDLIPIGRVPPNPFIFLESPKMKALIEDLRRTYDYVIIDGLPVLLFADATYLANYCDGVLLAVRYGRTNFKELEDSRDILRTSRSDIIGIVMNSVPHSRGSYYYRYYYKYYTKYYHKGEKEQRGGGEKEQRGGGEKEQRND
jgi:tyrosine-protein kinase Etk/Wzc